MALITLADVQQWLEGSTFTITGELADTVPEYATVEAKVLGRLTQKYDTSGWTDQDSVPLIVRSCIAMMTAGLHYEKRYAETSEGTNMYAEKLKKEAEDCIELILRGELSLTTTTDSYHTEILYQKSDPIFTMDKVY